MYEPSASWAQGGPIIEREMIELQPFGPYGWNAINFSRSVAEFGQTALIAAMRCYVASKLGDEVELPEELK